MGQSATHRPDAFGWRKEHLVQPDGPEKRGVIRQQTFLDRLLGRPEQAQPSEGRDQGIEQAQFLLAGKPVLHRSELCSRLLDVDAAGARPAGEGSGVSPAVGDGDGGCWTACRRVLQPRAAVGVGQERIGAEREGLREVFVAKSVQAVFGSQAPAQPFQLPLGIAELTEEGQFGGGEQGGEKSERVCLPDQGAQQIQVQEGQAAMGRNEASPARGQVLHMEKQRLAGFRDRSRTNACHDP